MMTTGAHFIDAARVLMLDVNALPAASQLLHNALNLPRDICPDEVREAARALLEKIHTGEQRAEIERTERQTRHDALMAETLAFLHQFTPDAKERASKRQRRRERKEFRAGLANELRETIAKGGSAESVRKRFGVSGFTIQRALNMLKRDYGDASMSNWQLRTLIRQNVKPWEFELEQDDDDAPEIHAD